MKGIKRTAALVAAVGLIATGTTVYAATVASPAEILSNLTGKTVEAVIEERAEGSTYGAIADEAGKLEEFKAQMLEAKKAWLDERVKAGTLTQERADEIYKAIESNQAGCTGNGTGRIGMGMGAGFGQGAGQCGLGFGRGMGQGLGNGFWRNAQ